MKNLKYWRENTHDKFFDYGRWSITFRYVNGYPQPLQWKKEQVEKDEKKLI